MASPTSRSLEVLRREGWTPGVVERHNTFSGKKSDFLGIIDIVAVQPTRMTCDGATMGVQACSGSGGDAAARVKKALAEWRVLPWLLAENRLEIWAWSKRSKDGVRGARKVWTLRRVEVRLDQPGVFAALLRAVERARNGDGSTRDQARAAFPDLEWERLSRDWLTAPAA